MATEIRAWEIIERQLKPLETSLAHEGRTEALDLEEWLASNPSVIRPEYRPLVKEVLISLNGRSIEKR